MKDFLIIANETKAGATDLAISLSEYINSKGGNAKCILHSEADDKRKKEKIIDINPTAECIISIGGDGTLIRSARDAEDIDIPHIGINYGTLGYLCEIEENLVFEAMDDLMAGRYMIESRMRLSGYASKTDELLESVPALNDIVIHRNGGLSVVRLYVYVNGKLLLKIEGDGIIISTPTGSTAYNLSAGGPIVDPVAQVMVITPINTHSLSSRSIIVDANDEIVIEMRERKSGMDESASVSVDGEYYTNLTSNEKMVIRRSGMDCRFIKLKDQSFLDILRRKMKPFDS